MPAKRSMLARARVDLSPHGAGVDCWMKDVVCACAAAWIDSNALLGQAWVPSQTLEFLLLPTGSTACLVATDRLRPNGVLAEVAWDVRRSVLP